MAKSLRRLLSRRRFIGLGLGAAAVGVGLLRGDSADAVPLSGVTAVVSVSTLKVRSYPSSTSSVVGTLRAGNVVTCTATASKYFKIRTSSVSGWVSSAYVTLKPAVTIQTIDRGPTTSSRICLTFDAGADLGNAGRILDILKSKQVHASFGMTGRWTNENPDMVRRLDAEGHTLINHTLTHRSMTGANYPFYALSGAERLSELFATEQILKAVCGRGARPFFRPPYGDYDTSVLNDVSAGGYAYNVMWTLDSLGWNGLAADDIVYRCLSNRGKGFIYLFHVGSQSADVDALTRIIDGLRSRGYRPGTIQQLLGIAQADSIPAETPATSLAKTPTRTPTTATARTAPTKSSTNTTTATQPSTAPATATSTSPRPSPSTPADPGTPVT